MAIAFTVNGTLVLDRSSGQQSGLQDDDTLISNDLTGPSTAFQTFLLGLTGDLELAADQSDYAADGEVASRGSNSWNLAC